MLVCLYYWFLLDWELQQTTLQKFLLVDSAEQALNLLAHEGSNNIEARIQGNFDLMEAIANRNEIRSMSWEVQKTVLIDELGRISQRGYLGIGGCVPMMEQLYMQMEVKRI